MLRRLFLVAALLFGTVSGADAFVRGGAGGASTIPLNGTLKMGAGGQVTGIDIASDGTKVVKTDVGGGWYCPAPCTGAGWIQVISATSMPSGDTNVGWTAANAGENVYTGVYEIKLAPSNPTIFYVYYFNNIYKGTYSAGAVTLVKTAFTTQSAQSNAGATKLMAYHIAVDPTDPNTVVAGGPANGISFTANGGTSWTAISGLCTPSSPDQGGGYFPAFDAANNQNVYIGCYGTGVYKSTTGASGSFSALGTGGPTTFQNLIVGSDGSVCVAANSGAQNLWGFFSGSWTNINSGGQGNRNKALVQGSTKFYGIIDDATDFNLSSVATHCGSGGTWTDAAFNNAYSSVASGVGWIGADYAFSGPNMTGSSAALDTTNNRLYSVNGTGLSYVATPSANTGLTWIDQSAPIEELVSNRVIGNCGSAGPFVAVWDRGIFKGSTSAAYPAFHGTVTPTSNSNQIVVGWDADCSNTVANFAVCLCNFFGVEQSGYTTNGGASWTMFSNFPSQNGASTSSVNGSIATGDDQTILWAMSDSGGSGKLFYTTNRGGSAWTAVTSALCPNIVDSGWVSSYFLNRAMIASDKSLTNTFYFYNSAVPSFYKMTFSGGTPTCVQTRTSALDALGSFQNSKLKAVPNQASNLFYTTGAQTPISGSQAFHRSTDGGTNWSAVSNVFSVNDFGFGAPKPGGGGYPAIFIYGLANGASVLGIYRSDDNAATWVGPLAPCPANIAQFGSCPNNSIDRIKSVDGDPNTYGRYYVGFHGTGAAYASSN